MGTLENTPTSQGTRKLARGTLYNMGSKLTYLFCGYIIYIVIGRVLGPENHGIFGISFISVNIFYLFLQSGIPQSTSKHIAGNESIAYPVLKAAMRIQLPWSIFLFVLLFGGAEFVASRILHDRGMTPYIRLAALSIIPFGLYSLYGNVLLGARHFRKEAIALVFRSIIRVICVIGFIFLGFGVKGAILGYFCSAALGALIAWSFCRFPKSELQYDGKQLLTFAIPLVITGGLVTLLLNMDSLFVKRILERNDQVGFYFAAASLSHSLYHLFTAFGATLLPSIARSYGQQNMVLTRKYIYQAIRYILILTLPIVAAISANSREVMTLLYGDSFLPAGHPLSILIVGNALFALSFTLNTIITSIGRPWVAVSFYVLAGIAGIMSMLLLTSTYGLYGAGIAISIAYAFCFMASSLYLYIKFRAFIHWLSLARIILAAGGIYILALNYPASGIFLPVYWTGLFCLYGGLLFILREPTSEDYAVIQGILGKHARFIPKLAPK